MLLLRGWMQAVAPGAVLKASTSLKVLPVMVFDRSAPAVRALSPVLIETQDAPLPVMMFESASDRS